MNVEFEYQYRDLGNFKNHGSVVFRNHSNLAIKELDWILVGLLGEDRTFVASRFGVPEMFFKEFSYDSDLDWEMHEYCNVSATALPVSDTRQRDIVDLISQIQATEN